MNPSGRSDPTARQHEPRVDQGQLGNWEGNWEGDRPGKANWEGNWEADLLAYRQLGG